MVTTLQINIQASDGRGRTTLTVVNIQILRNPTDIPPQFTNFDFNGIYTETILFYTPVNTTVSIKPTAFDNDLLVSGQLLSIIKVKFP